MSEKAKTGLWICAVYVLSLLCYLPMLLRRSGVMVPDVLLYLRSLFVFVPALVSAFFALCDHKHTALWVGRVKGISPKGFLVCGAAALVGVFATGGYSLWQETNLFRQSYPSIRSLAFSAAYLLATALVEEAAWRGFLLDRIAVGSGKPLAAGLTGVIWAIWHIPMWTIRNSLGPEEVIPLLIWAILISFILGMVYFRFEDLLSVSLLHMIFNICFLAPTKYNIIVVLISFIICCIFIKFKKGIKEF